MMSESNLALRILLGLLAAVNAATILLFYVDPTYFGVKISPDHAHPPSLSIYESSSASRLSTKVQNRSTTDSAHYSDSSAALAAMFASPDGVIHGNPMDHKICRDALLQAYGLDREVLSSEFDNRFAGSKHEKPKNLPPSFWSREALEAMRAPLGLHTYDSNSYLRANWDPMKERDAIEVANRKEARTAYIGMEKCGSSSIKDMLDSTAQCHNTTIKNIAPPADSRKQAFEGDCTFTFVRDPLSRLVSAYFTVNSFLPPMEQRYKRGMATWHDNFFPEIVQTYSFWNVTYEPERFRTFVNEMIERPNMFVRLYPMQHVYSMAGSLSAWFGSKVHFVGRMENFAEHWKLLAQDPHCSSFLNSCDSASLPLKTKKLTLEYVTKTWGGPKMLQSLGLKGWDHKHESKFDLPQYKVLAQDQQLLNKVIEHYWQDYVCFGYDPSYPELGAKYTGKFRKPY